MPRLRTCAFLLCCAAFCAAGAATLPDPIRRLNAAGGPELGRILALQICLDRRGLSCNTLDGSCGHKTQVALATWCAVNGRPYPTAHEAKAWETFFPNETDLFRTETVTAAEHAALVSIPAQPAEKAKLAKMGYQTIREMYAERGHLSERMLERLNPGLAWPNPPVGSVVTLPDVRPRRVPANPKRPDGEADVLHISLSRREITVFDAKKKLIGLFPCSIAASKDKLPPVGEIQVKAIVPEPNYTHTSERVGAGGRIERFIYPPGPNNPVGTSWIGLTLPTYGIHGTPSPEQIGRAESHGCFRLANWNAVRLRRMCDVGTSVVIVK
ncbi:MAG: L,D-transpeptidase [Kiritimatiellia bacterium]